MSRPFTSRRSPSSNSYVRVNGKIRAREVRVIGANQQQLGIFSLGNAINLARSQGVDLVEIAPNATPPVCRIVDYGKFRYEQAKKEKESKKHQHANKVKEIQLSATIDPHDFAVKLNHAVDFLCEDMKVKITLRFRGREMAHQEYGFQTVDKFTKEVAAYGHPDAPPKLIGKGINLMLSPLPRNKRAKHPHAAAESGEELSDSPQPNGEPEPPAALKTSAKEPVRSVPTDAAEQPASAFGHNPFADLDIKIGQ